MPRRGRRRGWRERVYAFMPRSSRTAAQLFCIPPAPGFEVGSQVEL